MNWTIQRTSDSFFHYSCCNKRRKETKEKMLFKKTRNFFMKSLQNLRNFLFGSYDKIPRTLFLNPLSCSSINQRSHHLDHIYPDFSNYNPSSVSDQCDQNNASLSNKQTANHNSTGVSSSLAETTIDHKMKQEVAASKMIQTPSYRCPIDGAYLLAQKMKDLEMMDVGDVDHTLDVEEALHYYSRLTCPAYVDIVNKFFMDMYTDFNLPQPPITISSSSRRLGPLAL